MPWSDNTLRPAVLNKLEYFGFVPETVLDVGCGAGSNYEFYKPWWPLSQWTGLEIFPRYVMQFSLFHRYQSLIVGDVRQVTDLTYDLVILGDVLEHMPTEDALDTLDRAVEQARMVLVALPIGHYPQGALEGNQHEEHVSEWTFEDFAGHPNCVFAVQNDVTGSFLLA